LAAAEKVIAITPFATEQLKQVAHILLPMGTFVESSGTYVNLNGVWQSFTGAAKPYGESRPGWKVLRVLGNLLGLTGFEYQSSEDVREELRKIAGEITAAPYGGKHNPSASKQNGGGANAAAGQPNAGVIDLPMYQIDALVRRAPSLQRTREGRSSAVTY
jgi:NADH-quinone oxidoreductase subunit G